MFRCAAGTRGPVVVRPTSLPDRKQSRLEGKVEPARRTASSSGSSAATATRFGVSVVRQMALEQPHRRVQHARETVDAPRRHPTVGEIVHGGGSVSDQLTGISKHRHCITRRGGRQRPVLVSVRTVDERQGLSAGTVPALAALAPANKGPDSPNHEARAGGPKDVPPGRSADAACLHCALITQQAARRLRAGSGARPGEGPPSVTVRPAPVRRGRPSAIRRCGPVPAGVCATRRPTPWPEPPPRHRRAGPPP